MDQQKEFTPDNPSSSAPASETAPAHVSSQIFDISEDSISPISTEAFAGNTEGASSPQASIPQTTEVEKRSTPPPEEELLDQKIGSFDATPFAPSVAPVMPGTPTVPRTAPAPQPVFRPAVAPQSKPIAPIAPRPVTSSSPIIQKRPQPTYQSGPILVKSQPQAPLQKPVAPLVPGQQRARSLQDEIAAALHTNFRPDAARTNAAPVPTRPGNSRIPSQDVPQQSPAQEAPQKPVSIAPQGQQGFQRETIKPVRTYEGDVAEAMSHKRTSTASIAIAESKKQQGTERVGDETPSHAGRKITMFVISLLLLGGGAYGAYYLYSKSALAPVTPIVPQQKASPSIIPANTQAVLTISSQSPNLMRASIAQEINRPQEPDSVREIIVATKDTSGQLVRVSSTDMVKRLDINTPDILTRSLTPNWMLGVYNSPDNLKSVFIVGTTNFFQNTFAGMLQWERVMADDLRQFLYPDNVEGILNANGTSRVVAPVNPLSGIDSILPFIGSTTTATSSLARATSTAPTGSPAASSTRQGTASTTPETVAPLRQYLTIRGKFEDRIVKNKDVRAFRTDNGQILFLYSFIDNTKLVISDKESTLAEILSRLEKQSFIR